MEQGMPYFVHPRRSENSPERAALFLYKGPKAKPGLQSREEFGHCPSDVEGDYVYPDPTEGDGNWPGYWVVPYYGKHEVHSSEQSSSSSGATQVLALTRAVETAASGGLMAGNLFAQYAPYQYQSAQAPPPSTQTPMQSTINRTSAPAPLPGRRFHDPPPAEPVARTMARPTAPAAVANMTASAPAPEPVARTMARPTAPAAVAPMVASAPASSRGRRFYGPPPAEPVARTMARPTAPAPIANMNTVQPRPQLPTSNTNTAARSHSPATPLGAKVGQPVPNDIAILVNEIKLRSRDGGNGVPKRQALMSKEYLIRTHFLASVGILRFESPLREWYGDERLFSMEWWEYLSSQKSRPG